MTGDHAYTELAAAPVCGLTPYEPGKPPEELEREYGVSNALKLASNENPFGVPDSVRTAMSEAIDNVRLYPDGAGFALSRALSEHLGVDPAWLTLGNGSNDILVLLAECFLTPETSAVYDQYSFIIYRLAVQATGAEARVAASNPPEHAQPFGHDLNAMLALVDATTRLVFIANPNNPTGTWVDGEALHDFLYQLPDHVLAVVDEAYYEYAVGEDYPGTLAWRDQFPNLVILRTFSKAYGLAGLRVGYSISNPGIAELLNRVRQPFNVNSVGQAAAVQALAEQDWVAQCHATNLLCMETLRAGLAELGMACLPSRANFLLAHIGTRAAACNEYLLRQGIIVRPVANYGLPEYLRITVGAEQDVTRLLAVLREFTEQGA
ncbi:MAG: histidinol-phosphate transaminase [Gammaproteobacteria bacterium]|jgi:histidinol-phosphate aminotransferase|nr:histidinol-phosphate transaminase [Gammaproteobacteria bacterium]MDP6616360.1 histidinol-phosphate transaminase [Gammaproteobacteria bacterium]MDP6695332.1 histidinol-phosphate transaminase [Gammaproteobacteria bacterium]